MPRRPDYPEMITPSEVGKRMGICPSTIHQLLRHGKFPVGFAYESENGRWAYKIPREAFDKYMRGEIGCRPEA